jgi:hypothetical protein
VPGSGENQDNFIIQQQINNESYDEMGYEEGTSGSNVKYINTNNEYRTISALENEEKHKENDPKTRKSNDK